MWGGTGTSLARDSPRAPAESSDETVPFSGAIAPQNMSWLILARALAGVGGGGIVSLVWTITSEIVEVQNQAKLSQALSITWACSAVAGPLLGGLFSSES